MLICSWVEEFVQKYVAEVSVCPSRVAHVHLLEERMVRRGFILFFIAGISMLTPAENRTICERRLKTGPLTPGGF